MSNWKKLSATALMVVVAAPVHAAEQVVVAQERRHSWPVNWQP